MGFCFKYIKRIISSVLLAGVVSSPVMGAANGGAADLGNLNSEEKRTGSSSIQQDLDNSANFDIKDSNQNFLSHNKRDASDVSAKDKLKAKKAPGDTDVKADKKTTKNLVYTANGPSNKEGESNGGKQIINEPGYLKSAVNAVKNADPKVISAALLTPATAGLAGALIKDCLLNKDGNTKSIPDPVDPGQNSDNEKSNENDDPNALQNEPGKKKISKLVYLWITLSVALLAVLVVLFLYRARILIKILGYDKCVKIFHWSDLDKKYYYREIFGYEEYIKKFPNDWWELYENVYIKSLQVFGKEFFYVYEKLYKEYEVLVKEYKALKEGDTDINKEKRGDIGEKIDLFAEMGMSIILKKGIFLCDLKNFNNIFKLENNKLCFKDFEGDSVKILGFLADNYSFGSYADHVDGNFQLYVRILQSLNGDMFYFAHRVVDAEIVQTRNEGFELKVETKMKCDRILGILANFRKALSEIDGTFFNDKIDKMNLCVEKYSGGIEEATKAYEKNKDQIEDKDKNNFIYDYIFEKKEELLKKYEFLNPEDLKIENNPNLIINNSYN